MKCVPFSDIKIGKPYLYIATLHSNEIGVTGPMLEDIKVVRVFYIDSHITKFEVLNGVNQDFSLNENYNNHKLAFRWRLRNLV